jgi:peptide deformylase
MAERVLKDNQVAGLAAPQVGVGKKISIVKTDFKKPEVLVLINPEIIRKSRETEIGEEGCLSFPGVFLKIRRAKEVEVESMNMDGKTIKIQAEGMKARIFQHEIDHLNGVLFFHRLEFLKKIKFMLKNPSLKL